MDKKEDGAVATDELPDIDPNILIKEEAPAKSETKEEPIESDDSEASAKEETKTEVAGDEPAKAVEGTPDKALQKLQQELAATQRTLSELKAKQDAGDDLTAKEQKKLDKAVSSVDRLKAALTGDDFDVLDNARQLAEATIEVHERNNALQERLDRYEKKTAQDESTRFFAEAKAKYPGVDYEAVWTKAAEDTMALLEVTPEELQANPVLHNKTVKAATKTFNERCTNAAKAIAAKTPAPTGKKPAPLVTPGGAKVQTGTTGVMSAATNDDEAEMIRMARSIIKE